MMQAPKKHKQFILAMEQAYFADHPKFGQGIVKYPAGPWLEEIQSHLIIAERHMLETNPKYRQLLPYVILQRRGVDGVMRFLPYRRMSGVGESRLVGNVSVGYGGHIDLQDMSFCDESIVYLHTTIRDAIFRELDEELRFSNTATETQVSAEAGTAIQYGNAFILDDSNEVGKVHVGIVIEALLKQDVRATSAEAALESMPAMTASELLDSGLPLENWTRLYLEDVESKEVAGSVKIQNAGISGTHVSASGELPLKKWSVDYAQMRKDVLDVKEPPVFVAAEAKHRSELYVKLDDSDPNPRKTIENAIQETTNTDTPVIWERSDLTK